MTGLFALSRLLPVALILALVLGGLWLHGRATRAEGRADAAELRATVAEVNRKQAEDAMAELGAFMRRSEAARQEAVTLVDDLRKMEGWDNALDASFVAALGRVWPPASH